MNKLKQIGLVLVFGAICFSAGKFLSPAKTEIKEVEKIVYRESTDLSRDYNKREIIKPDGTKITETTRSTTKRTNTEINQESEKSSTTEVRAEYRVNLLYGPAMWNQSESIQVDIQKRLFSEIYLGVWGTKDAKFGVSLGVGF